MIPALAAWSICSFVSKFLPLKFQLPFCTGLMTPAPGCVYAPPVGVALADVWAKTGLRKAGNNAAPTAAAMVRGRVASAGCESEARGKVCLLAARFVLVLIRFVVATVPPS